jgi:hypothetical protein
LGNTSAGIQWDNDRTEIEWDYNWLTMLLETVVALHWFQTWQLKIHYNLPWFIDGKTIYK